MQERHNSIANVFLALTDHYVVFSVVMGAEKWTHLNRIQLCIIIGSMQYNLAEIALYIDIVYWLYFDDDICCRSNLWCAA